MKKRKMSSLSLNKKTISNLEVESIKGGTLFPTMFPCWSQHSCPTINCTEGLSCGTKTTAPV